MESKKLHEKLKHWGFECDCAICEDHRATSAAILTQRKNFFEELKTLMVQQPRGPAVLKAIEKKLLTLERTHTRPASEVPRVHLWDPQLALANVYQNMSVPKKSLEWISKALESLGYVLSGADATSASIVVKEWGLVDDYTVEALLQARRAFAVLGLKEKEAQAYEYARLAFKMVVGEDSAFDEMYGMA